ncbi:MOSC domain-containing protein [Actinospongicola halichondriae]|uniref:MOSC domain-containing protein n=1 Tax=Actinospongicola halichondriae TaxID=3236844 RepID=UPI003D463044
MTTIGTVASVHRFPVKSMQGDAPTSVEVDENGIVGDRTWALRDAETGKLVSAKRPRLWRALLDCTASGTGDDVTVTLPEGETYGIHDAGLRVSLSALLGREIAIEASSGPMQGTYESDWPEIEGITLAGEMEFPTNLTGEGTSFVDLGILHLLTTASMATLASAAPDVAVDARRFRPSILLDTPDLDGFPENEWAGRTLTIGDVVIALGDPAPRCIMTTVAQGDLPREPAVLQAIAAENRLTNPLGTFACLGCYANVATGGTIGVGAPITLR